MLDEDDEPPRFHQPSYTFSLFENNVPGHVLGNITASDPDTPGSEFTQTFLYSLDPSTNPNELFRINPLSGTLSVSRSLDCESRAQYHLYAHVVSRVTVPPQSSQVQILIIVRDMNDNAPFIQYPSPGNNTVHMDSEAEMGSYVTHVKAVDIDRDTADELLYVISAGNQRGLFAMSERNGVIRTATGLG